MTAIVLSRRARDDLKRIWAYIALDDDRAADRLLLALDARIARLRDFPGIGTLRDEIRPGARTLVHGRYLILYEHDADADRIEIVAVVEGMRDLDRLF
ncbi:MAG: type II toxin-antitoxin system RelE/ParE family toxin [Sphingomonas phyllosphaerae]|uniref:type II toxin-antitoxin system RelE/ParE family toxin n=1 Tax=Sphingomonas phyllosphaerae TaxID=257003 RepID=UPI002FF9E175